MTCPFLCTIWQGELSDKAADKQHAKKKNEGLMGTLVRFALGTDGYVKNKQERTTRHTENDAAPL